MRPVRQPHVVDQEIELRERVRKLELRFQTLTIRPWRWVPDKKQANVIAEHSMLMGVPQFQIYTRYSRHPKYIDMAPSWPARRLAEIERAEGTYPVNLAKQFMAFRQEIGVYPPQSSFRYFRPDEFWNWNVLGLVGRYGEVDYPDVGGPYRPTDFEASDFRWWNHKLIHLAGPPVDDGGSWEFKAQGTKLQSGNSEGVDLTRTQTAPVLTEDSYIYWTADYVPTFSYGDRNSYYQPLFAGPPPPGGWPRYDCGDPWDPPPPRENFKPYALDPGSSVPGLRTSWFLSIGYYCPANESFSAGFGIASDGTGGNLHYISVPASSVYIDRPPVPWRGQRTWPPMDIITREIPQVDPFEGALAQASQMAYRVQLAFEGGRFPLVRQWYQHRIPVKEPKSARYWHRARVIPPWDGMVEVKVCGTCKVQIRGSVTIDMTTIGWEGRDTPIFALPAGVDVPNNNGMVIAKVVLADGTSRLAPFQLMHGPPAYRPNGTEIPSPPGYLHVYRKSNWFAGNFITASNMPITINFYGSSFNCWPPPKSK